MKKMTLTLKAISFSLLTSLFLSSASFAETGFYIGGSLGNAQVGLKDTDDTLHLDGDDVGYKIFGGFQFTLLAVEGGYVDFGSIEESNSQVEVSGFSAFGKLSMGLGPVEVFGKLGGFVWESDFEAAGDKYSDDGFDPAVGLGAAFNLGSVGVRAEYEYFDIDGFDDVSMISLGATLWLL